MELIPTEQKHWAAMLHIYRNLVKPAFCALVFSFFILMRKSTRIIKEVVTITAPPTPAPTPMPTAVPRETFSLTFNPSIYAWPLREIVASHLPQML